MPSPSAFASRPGSIAPAASIVRRQECREHDHLHRPECAPAPSTARHPDVGRQAQIDRPPAHRSLTEQQTDADVDDAEPEGGEHRPPRASTSDDHGGRGEHDRGDPQPGAMFGAPNDPEERVPEHEEPRPRRAHQRRRRSLAGAGGADLDQDAERERDRAEPPRSASCAARVLNVMKVPYIPAAISARPASTMSGRGDAAEDGHARMSPSTRSRIVLHRGPVATLDVETQERPSSVFEETHIEPPPPRVALRHLTGDRQAVELIEVGRAGERPRRCGRRPRGNVGDDGVDLAARAHTG